MRQDKSSGEFIDGALRRFNRRLESILGSERIPGAEKRAKAEVAIRAVDELISDIDTRFSIPPKRAENPLSREVPIHSSDHPSGRLTP